MEICGLRAILARFTAPFFSIFFGLLLFFILAFSDAPLLEPWTVVYIFLYVIPVFIAACLYSAWDRATGQIVAVSTCIVLLSPLAYWLYADLQYRPAKICNHLALAIIYVTTGLLMPLVTLFFIRLAFPLNPAQKRD
jgi:hypothetical protein